MFAATRACNIPFDEYTTGTFTDDIGECSPFTPTPPPAPTSNWMYIGLAFAAILLLGGGFLGGRALPERRRVTKSFWV